MSDARIPRQSDELASLKTRHQARLMSTGGIEISNRRFLPGLRELYGRKFQIFLPVSRRNLNADPGFALRNDRKREGNDIDSLAQEDLCHPRGYCSVAQDDGNDGVFAGRDAEPESGHAFAEEACVLLQALAQGAAPRQEIEHL